MSVFDSIRLALSSVESYCKDLAKPVIVDEHGVVDPRAPLPLPADPEPAPLPPPPAPGPVEAPRPLLVLDLYREEAEDGPRRPLPEFSDLFAARHRAAPCQYVGLMLKCTEGTRYPTDWFVTVWRRARDCARTPAGDVYGAEWFRGAYLFPDLEKPGIPQADFWLRTIEKAGGYDQVGCMSPWLDIEYTKRNAGATKQQVLDCVIPIVDKVYDAIGRRMTIYGGRQVSIKLRIPRVGLPLGTRQVNASYTEDIGLAGIEAAGFRLKDLDLSQFTDGKTSHFVTQKTKIRLPRVVPGVKHGDLDASVAILGGLPSTLPNFIARLVRP